MSLSTKILINGTNDNTEVIAVFFMQSDEVFTVESKDSPALHTCKTQNILII